RGAFTRGQRTGRAPPAGRLRSRLRPDQGDWPVPGYAGGGGRPACGDRYLRRDAAPGLLGQGGVGARPALGRAAASLHVELVPVAADGRCLPGAPRAAALVPLPERGSTRRLGVSRVGAVGRARLGGGGGIAEDEPGGSPVLVGEQAGLVACL